MSSFQKIKFKEIINGDKIEYMINDKFVTKDTYTKLNNDETLFVLPPLPKVINSPENRFRQVEEDINEDEQCDGDCPECQELALVVSDIKEMSDEEAIEGLRHYIESIKVQTHLEVSSAIYAELGNSMIKVASRLEIQLEDFYDSQSVDNSEL